MRALPQNRPSLLEGRTHFLLYRENVRMPELAAVNLKNTSFDLCADLRVPEAGADGGVICQGGPMAGWSLYVLDGRPTYLYNWFGRELTAVASPAPLPAGAVALGLTFEYGIDTGAPVGPYAHHFPIMGVIDQIEIELRPDRDHQEGV